jgi:hypothetical protein
MGRTEWLKASVQYGDWQGTAAADDSDPMAVSVDRYLHGKKLIKPGEFLLAVQLYTGSETKVGKLDEPYIRAYLLDAAGDFETAKARLDELEAAGESIPVREVEINVPLDEFVSWFKRFSVMLTWRNLPLTDRECRVTEHDE